MATDRQRGHMRALGYWLASTTNEPLIDYSQFRPMKNIQLHEQEVADKFAAGKHISMDCSEAYTCICKWAGLKDPCGLNFDGYGGTESMLAALPHYSKASNAHVGAAVIYDGPAHVSMILEPGNDPLLFSHGSEAGPRLVRHSVEMGWHTSVVAFLNIAKL